MRQGSNTRRIFTDTNSAGGVKGNGGRDKMKGTIIGAIIVLVLLLILAAVITGEKAGRDKLFPVICAAPGTAGSRKISLSNTHGVQNGRHCLPYAGMRKNEYI